jgi:hypothetical protein
MEDKSWTPFISTTNYEINELNYFGITSRLAVFNSFISQLVVLIILTNEKFQ